MRLDWATDIHLNFLDDEEVKAFASSIDADGLVLSGDISEAIPLLKHLKLLADGANCPIYFVLGNHDFYKGSIEAVQGDLRALDDPRLVWLSERGAIELSPKTVLLGCDGWGDARYGNYDESPVRLNDFILIEELSGLSKPALKAKLRALGDRWGAWVREHLPPALEKYEEILFVTHVPPFDGACWHLGKVSDENWLPHFTCKAVGDALLDAAKQHPTRQIRVLCGHTHSSGRMNAAPNLEVLTGAARYGRPEVQQTFEIQ